MNYLAEIRAFYDRLELNPLPAPAIALWHALMSIANKTGWQQEFTAAVSVLVLKSGLNAQAIKRARNRLEQEGYIRWRARGGNQAAVYEMVSLVVQNTPSFCTTNCTSNVPQSEPQGVPQHEPQSVPINKQKQKRNIEKDSKESQKKFIPPTVEMVLEYCLERKNAVDPEAFVDYYESKGWMVGSNRMKDWKAAVRTWEKRRMQSRTEAVKPKQNQFHNFHQRDTDLDAVVMEQVRERLGKERVHEPSDFNGAADQGSGSAVFPG